MLRKLKPKEKEPTLKKREAQMIANEAKALLKKRQQEFVKKLKRYTFIEKENPRLTRIYIKLPESGKVAEIYLYFDKEDKENKNLLISKISVGNYRAKKDSLRDLGIGAYLILVAKECALRNRYPGLTLDCEKKLVDYYKRFGFRTISKRRGKNGKIIVEMEFNFK